MKMKKARNKVTYIGNNISMVAELVFYCKRFQIRRLNMKPIDWMNILFFSVSSLKTAYWTSSQLLLPITPTLRRRDCTTLHTHISSGEKTSCCMWHFSMLCIMIILGHLMMIGYSMLSAAVTFWKHLHYTGRVDAKQPPNYKRDITVCGSLSDPSMTTTWP